MPATEALRRPQTERPRTPRERFADQVKLARLDHAKLVDNAKQRGLPDFAIDLAVGIGSHWADRPNGAVVKRAEDLQDQSEHPAVVDLEEDRRKIDPSNNPETTRRQVAEHLARRFTHEQMQRMNGSGPAHEKRAGILHQVGRLAFEVVSATQDARDNGYVAPGRAVDRPNKPVLADTAAGLMVIDSSEHELFQAAGPQVSADTLPLTAFLRESVRASLTPEDVAKHAKEVAERKADTKGNSKLPQQAEVFKGIPVSPITK